MPILSATQLEARRLCSEFVPTAIEELKKLAVSGPVTARLNAIEQLLSRALGKPEAHLTVDHQDDAGRKAAFKFALEMVKRNPELAERVMRGDANVIDVTPAPKALRVGEVAP